MNRFVSSWTAQRLLRWQTRPLVLVVTYLTQLTSWLRLRRCGAWTLLLLGGLGGSLALAQNGITVAGGNGFGSAPNQLFNPFGLFLDGAGNRYVADALNHRIQKFGPNSTAASSGTTVAGGNGAGSAPNQLNNPSGVFVDGAGNLYVADTFNSRIQKFAPNSTSASSGTTVAGGNGPGSAPNQLNNPFGLYVDKGGNLYVAGTFNSRIQKFAPNSTSASSGTTVAGRNRAGNARNQLNQPTALYVDGAGNLYVADRLNNRIQKFAPNSTFATTVAGDNGAGSAPNQLNSPFGLYVDKGGNLFVADAINNRIQKFGPNSTAASSGTTVAGGNGFGSASNQLGFPSGVFVDGAGNLYVADQNNNRIQQFGPNTPPTPVSNPDQTATQGLPFSYTVNAFAGSQPPASLTYSATISPANSFSFNPATRVISGTPTTTGPSSVTISATNPGGLSAATVFTITVNASAFAIVSVGLVNCQRTNADKNRYLVRFTPLYSGLTGQLVTFLVVNELLSTTAPGPYTLRLNANNPTITLKATQTGTAGEASFVYNWLAACTSGGRSGAVSREMDLRVVVLGNPVVGDQVEAEVRGAEGQPLQVRLIDSRGREVTRQQRASAQAVERLSLAADSQSGSLLLLQVATPTQQQTVKVLKQ